MITDPFTTLAAIRRIDALEELRAHIEAQPPIGEAEFRDAVRSLLVCGVQGIEIARMLGVESSCITRWTRNGATPHHIGRATYARHLPAIVRRHVDGLRAEYQVPSPPAAKAA